MKRWNIKSFIAGVLATVLVLGLSATAWAANYITKSLYYNDIQIYLNGKLLTPKDATGKTVDPFIIEGTTYLPIRALCEALGLEVAWDNTLNAVVLGKTPVQGEPDAWLGDLVTFSGSAWVSNVANGEYDEFSTANNGDTFERHYQPYKACYLLKGAYDRFTGTYFLSQYYRNTRSQYRFLVYLDDHLAYTSEVMSAGVEPFAFSIDISDAYKMEIVVEEKIDGYGEWSTTTDPSYTPIGDAALWID